MSTALTWREKAFLVRVTTIPAERHPDTGRRLHGAREMGADGVFTHSHEHMARYLGTTPEVVRQIVKALLKETDLRERCLDVVQRGRYGRASTLEAFVVLDKTTGLMADKTTPQQGGGIDGDSRMNPDKTTPLTYKTPDRRNQEITSRDSRHDPIAAQQQRGGDEAACASLPAYGCQWHEHMACPDDCANADHDREVSA
ncbi:MAG: hypothetical protein U0R78_19640 [Nocardioidaceae bacterium]